MDLQSDVQNSLEKFSHPSPSNKRKVFIAVVILVLIGAGMILKNYFFSAKSEQRSLRSVAVEVESARRASISRTITAIGSLRANQMVTVKPFISGLVSKIHVEGGQEVKFGQTIVSIDDRKYRNKLKEAEAKLAYANLDFARNDKLVNLNYGRKKAQEQALAEKHSAEAAVDQAKKEIEDCQIVSPFDGIISLNELSVGSPVNESVELFSVIDLDPIKIEFRIPAQYLRNLSVGQSLNVSVDGFLDQKFEAYIEAIDTRVDPNAHTIAVRAIIRNENNMLRPGLFARIDLQVGSKDDALVLPTSAVQINGKEESVYKLMFYGGKENDETFVAVRQPVSTGLQEGDKIEITRGIVEGDLIVTVGHLKIRDGTPVTFEGDNEYLKKIKEEKAKKNDNESKKVKK